MSNGRLLRPAPPTPSENQPFHLLFSQKE